MLGKSAFEFYHYLDSVPPKVEFHQHPFYELFFFLDGNVNYTIEGKTYKLRPGDILLTNSLDIHRPEIFPGKPYERIIVWLEDRFFEQLLAGGGRSGLLLCRRRPERLPPHPSQSRWPHPYADSLPSGLHGPKQPGSGELYPGVRVSV